jgi:hypothetical protein
LIQKTRHLDSIVARALLVADFIDSIDPKRTLPLALSSASEDPLRLAAEWRTQLLLAK